MNQCLWKHWPVSESIQILIFVFIFVVSAADNSFSAWYVVPSAEIPLRTGQGIEYRIIELIPDGTKVELIEEGEKWVKIRTPKGNEGWILKRYLTNQTPLVHVVTFLKNRNRELQAKVSSLEERLSKTSLEQSSCAERLSSCTGQYDRLMKEYQSLKRDAANVVELKQALNDTTIELNQLKQSFSACVAENKRLKNNEKIKWFLAGGGVLVIGWLIGLVMGRGRRRRSTLL